MAEFYVDPIILVIATAIIMLVIAYFDFLPKEKPNRKSFENS